MWLFLFTEFMLFGGLFHPLCRLPGSEHPRTFSCGERELNVVLGRGQHVILLTSSLTMAVAITAIQRGAARLAMRLVG